MLAYEKQFVGMAPPTPPSSDEHLDLHTRLPLSNKTNSSSTPKESVKQDTKHTHIWLVSGPAGCGKSTVAEFVSKTLSVPYLEGDEVCAKIQSFILEDMSNTISVSSSIKH